MRSGSSGIYSLLLVLITLGLYFPILGGDFVYDSRAQILTDPYIHQGKHLSDILSLKVMSQDVLDQGRPIHLLSLMLDSCLWGKSPTGYHWTNVLIHTLNAFLLFWILFHSITRLSPSFPCLHEKNKTPESSSIQENRSWIVFLGALIFTVHPLQSEAVCEVSYREDLLSTLFLLSGLLFAVRSKPDKNRLFLPRAFLIAFLFFLSVASKENGVAGPFILLAFWFFIFRNTNPLFWGWTLSLSFLVVTLFLISKFTLQPSFSWISPRHPTWLGGSFGEMLQIQPRLWVFGLIHLLFPIGLCADYGPYSIRHLSLPLSMMVLGVLMLAGWFICRRCNILKLGFAFFILPLIPVSNFVPIFIPHADRYYYMPMAGIAVIFIGLFHSIERPTWKSPMIGILLGVILFYATTTLFRELTWHSRLSLWKDTSQKNPASSVAWNNLGYAYFDQKNNSMAIESWKRAIQISHGNEPDSWAGLAIGLKATGHHQEAWEAFQKACHLDSRYNDPEKLKLTLSWEKEHLDAIKSVQKISGLKKTE